MSRRRLIPVLVAGAGVLVIGIVLAAVVTGFGRSADTATGDPGRDSGPSGSVAPSEPTTPSESPVVAPSAAPATTAGAYIEWSPSAVADAEGRVLLFFHAPWCPQCRELDEDIRAAGPPDGVTIVKVDYDSRQDLRRDYGVTLQTTVVEVDGSGTLIRSVVPYDDPSLDAVLAGLG